MSNTEKLTKEEVAQRFKAGLISTEEMIRLMASIDRQPPTFKVAEKSGWLSIYFDGLRYPLSLPYECAQALFSEEVVAAAHLFMEENKTRFKVKNKNK